LGAKIPREIRLEVIRKWLQGKARGMIANEVGVGAGTGLDIQSFAPLIRLREVLEEKEWFQGVRPGQQEEKEDDDHDNEIDQVIEKKVESLIMTIEVFCFKKNLPLRQFFDLVYNMYLLDQNVVTAQISEL